MPKVLVLKVLFNNKYQYHFTGCVQVRKWYYSKSSLLFDIIPCLSLRLKGLCQMFNSIVVLLLAVTRNSDNTAIIYKKGNYTKLNDIQVQKK